MSSTSIFFLKNTVQHYAWGSPTKLAALLGQPPSGNPEAELWLGDHPKAPSYLRLGDRLLSLGEWIRKNPRQALGENFSRQTAPSLPFLFKVLAVERPLSLQAHPGQAKARAGYLRESRSEIPLQDSRRNFKDPNAKPEILCAVSPFWALAGFCRPEEILRKIKLLNSPILSALAKALRRRPAAAALRSFFRILLELRPDLRRCLIKEVLAGCRGRQSDPVFRWILLLGRLYPEDSGILAPLFLNLIRLKPCEAMYLPPGCLHSYLAGTGVELMGNSDNVLRGGLTSKHLDLKGLLGVLNFSTFQVPVLKPKTVSACERTFFPATRCRLRLSILELRKGEAPHQETAGQGPHLMICLKGSGRIHQSGTTQEFRKGDSWFVSASAETYTLQGSAKIYKASAPPFGKGRRRL